MKLGPLPLIPNFVRQQIVVCIEVLHPLTARQRKQPVSGDVAALIGAGFPAHMICKPLDDGEAAIRRPVVDDDDFDVAPRLRERALDRVADPALGVETRNQNGDHCDGTGRRRATPAIAAMSALTGKPARYLRRAWATCQWNVSR
jgi:hypothetical protein